MSEIKALVLREAEGKVRAAIERIDESTLPPGEVTVAVEYSTLNYKDGLVLNGLGRLVRSYPHVPGIDLAGTVERSEAGEVKPGDKVVLTGWRVGELTWGGYAEKARVKASQLVKLPEGLTTKRAMAIGTAGFTAMLAAMALEEHGLRPDKGDVLVTGAAGGLGSVAVAVLAKLGYRVVASTGRPDQHAYLSDLGAAGFIDRAELAKPPSRPLDSERWAGAIDAVGSTTLATLLTQLKYGASVASCGLAGGNDLPTSVVPFLLRGVNLLGIDSVMCPVERRKTAWSRLARDLPTAKLDALTETVPLEALPELGQKILKGGVRGRVVVDLRG
ncbi:MAG TPA: MDR family oxidoreductase [Stellaceae bacterium]|jgi:acrylyl-CoA reductase (NADPH)|nr:MDR family oxidoreductase [Stellaceae bacterium]